MNLMYKSWGIVDIDGTISDCTARLALARAARKEPNEITRSNLWDEFHSKCLQDPPHAGEVALCLAWLYSGGPLCFITGRSEKFRAETKRWLVWQGFPDTTPLLMRGEGNWARSTDYKKSQMALFRETIAQPGDRVSWILEDNDALVAQWRALGFTCLQPRASAF